MKRILLIGLIMGSVAFQTGCVEVKDTNEDEHAPQPPAVPAMVEAQTLGTVVIEGETFLYDGQFLSRKQLDFEIYQQKGAASISHEVKDLEFQMKELIFKEGAILYTLGHRVRLHVGRLIADRGRIATFPEGTKALFGKPGRSGGHLFLNVGVAEEGRLFVQMRGEDGGDGLVALLSKSLGVDGVDGKSVEFMCGTSVAELEKVHGGNGADGAPGSPGGNGGSSGTVEWKIQKGPMFAYQFTKSPGRGGKGGAGGPAGRGGKAGAITIISLEKIVGTKCFPRVVPRKGKDGQPGISGADGKNGAVDSICVTRDGKATCF